MKKKHEPPCTPTIDKVVFGVAGAITLAFIIWGFVSSESLGAVSSTLLTGTLNNFGWLFVGAATIFAVFIIVVAVSRFGRVKLGKDEERPEFKTASWVAMMFATGMGIGLIFFGVAEPLFFYVSPPPGTVEGSTPEAIATAMGTTAFHWTIYPWAMYAIVGLGMAYSVYRLGRAHLFSSMFAGLFGEKITNGVGGKTIDILAILATLFGSACSLGLGALQIGGGLKATGVVENVTSPILVAIIAILTIAFVASAVSGIRRGIQLLANTNMILAVLLAVIVFIGGPTLFILNVVPTTIGALVGDFAKMASRTGAEGQDVADWLGSWTVFYWAWWISWTPFVGMFIARISRGRTIRQFVIGVLTVPSIVSIVWFSIFGGGAIGIQERYQSLTTVTDGVSDLDFDASLFNFLEQVAGNHALYLVLSVISVVLIAIFFVTGADSASIVMGGLSQRGAEEPSKWNVALWGTLMGAVAAAMLLAGGSEPSEALNGLKNVTIVSALPFTVVMLVLCVAIWKDLSKHEPVLVK